MTSCALRKKHKSSSEVHSASSADIIGSNEDLINQILLCLPVPSLVRFKSVSKQWDSLISNPRFGLTHTLKNPSSLVPSGLFFRFPTDLMKVYSVSLSKTRLKIPSFPLRFGGLKGIVQSCNGLNLFRFEQGYCVRNIVTNQQQLVPLPTLYPSARDRAWFLAFDPLVSSHYKILCAQEVEDGINKFLVFSSETGHWKDTGVTTYEVDWWWKSVKGVYLQGAIYFLSYTYSVLKTFYRFDVEAENLTEIPRPSWPAFYHASIRYFGEYNGHLHLVCRLKSPEILHVLELDTVRQMLFRKYQVSIDGLISQFPEVCHGFDGLISQFPEVNKVTCDRYKYAFSILSVVRGAEKEDSAIVMAIPGKVVSYNGKSMKSEVLSELPLETEEFMAYGYSRDQAFDFPFIPTLHPV